MNPRPTSTGRPVAVLVVDDNRDCAESLAQILRAFNYDVRTASTPKDAVMEVCAFRPNAVVMDIGLPGMDGYQVARWMCNCLPRRPLFVAVTGHAHLQDRSRAEGFDLHFLKPFDPAELVKALAVLFESGPSYLVAAR